jgi:spermidine synthase
MKRTERLAEATAPDGSVLVLSRHDGAYTIRVNGADLMSTRRFHSEEKLAELACAGLAGQEEARVLIGGLGLGFTLRAALRQLAGDARVVVAELLQAVIDWNRNPDFALASAELADPRVDVVQGDVAGVLAANPGAFHAIMLDVDNGAGAFTTSGNAGLYQAAGIRSGVAALAPGGTLAYWSADADPRFEAALGRAGLAVKVERPRAHATSGGRHFIYLGKKSSGK